MSTSEVRLVLLGTAGGPLPSPVRSGIAQAVVAGDRVYLVDCGSGVTRQLRRAKLLKNLHAVFLTHLHSDHDCDYFNLFLLGWPILQWNPAVSVYGPGRAGRLPDDCDPAETGAAAPVVSPENPTPGLADLTRLQIDAHAYDLNVRMRETGRADLTKLIDTHEIELPPDAHARHNGARPSTPIPVFADDRVRVTAVLVNHGPVFPSFAFRFDTDSGAIVISGDTAPCAGLISLASGADVLVHEVYDDTGTTDRGGDGSRESRLRDRHLLDAHTPLSRVGEVASRARVRRLVLTHFIPGDDVLPDEHWVRGAAFDGEVIVGRDLAEVAL
ncbi:MAG TPA: MBL fold metallo-hydrolase [Candidatus Dormibacteraeota bacterium]